MADRIFAVDPSFSQGFDGDWHTLGNRHVVSSAGRLVGGRVRYPDDFPDNLIWIVYRESDGAVVAELDAVAHFGLTAVLDDWNAFTSADFDTPGDVAYDPAEAYIACAATDGDFLVSEGFSFPAGTGIVQATAGRFHDGGSGPVFPENTDSGTAMGADVEVEPDEAEPVVIDWTPVQLRLTPQALAATPGMVTVAWTTVSLALTVVAPAVTPGMVTVAWTPVQLAISPQPLTATPAMVTVAWTTVGLTLTVVAPTVTPGMVTVAWSTVTFSLAPHPFTVTPGAVTVAWTTVVLALSVQPFTIEMLIEPGLATPAGSVLALTATGTVHTPIPTGSVLALTAAGVVHTPTPAGAVSTPVASGRP